MISKLIAMSYVTIRDSYIIIRFFGFGFSIKNIKNIWYSDKYTNQNFWDIGKTRFRFLTPNTFP